MKAAIRNLVALTCLLLPLPARAGTASLPSVPAGNVFLWNGGSKSVVFYLSTDKTNWNRFSLASDKAELFTFGDKEDIWATVKTRDVQVTKKLELKKRYRIYLDATRSVWDFAEIQPN